MASDLIEKFEIDQKKKKKKFWKAWNLNCRNLIHRPALPKLRKEYIVFAPPVKTFFDCCKQSFKWLLQTAPIHLPTPLFYCCKLSSNHPDFWIFFYISQYNWPSLIFNLNTNNILNYENWAIFGLFICIFTRT